jgi:hypothetical protein
MKLNILNCPSCGGSMVVSEVKCAKCDLRIRKEFEPCEFCQLPDDDYEFLKLFLRTQGRITEIEKLLGISYPTIKHKIEDLLARLHLAPAAVEDDPLDSLAEGKISVDEAVAILKQRRKR